MEEVAAQCRKAGSPNVTTVVTDVSSKEQCHALVDAAIALHSTIHVLVLNAGIPGPWSEVMQLPSSENLEKVAFF